MGKNQSKELTEDSPQTESHRNLTETEKIDFLIKYFPSIPLPYILDALRRFNWNLSAAGGDLELGKHIIEAEVLLQNETTHVVYPIERPVKKDVVNKPGSSSESSSSFSSAEDT